jgi:hypothetical protein
VSVRPGCASCLLAAGLLLLGVVGAEAQELGRLFTTPQERASLDEIRYQSRFAAPEPQPVPEPATQTSAGEPEPTGPVISRLTVNGVVRRSGGPGTVWVNGDEVERGGITREGILVQGANRQARNVRLQLPSGISSIELKPGQEIDVLSGTVLEPYEKGAGASGESAFEAPREGGPRAGGVPPPASASPATPGS